MHKIQEKLLKLAQERNLGQMKLREVGGLIGIRSPQVIKHHLNQLEKKGLLRVDKARGIIEKPQKKWLEGLLRTARLLAIPVLGTANCGPAELLAEENVEGYLRVSSTLLDRQSNKGLFAIRASGPSMNRTEVHGRNIDDGDFLVINSRDTQPRDGDIVLSVIDGMANIKKFYKDTANKQIVLMSESTQDFPPICIDEHDDYFINGKVVQVIKKPKV